MNWEDRKTVKKGLVGERILDSVARRRGLIPYQANHEGAHPIDRLFMDLDVTKLIFADAKAKARRNIRPDTGIDIKHYRRYLRIQEERNADVFLLFVDEILKRAYGNIIRKLDEPYNVTLINGQVICYPQEFKGIRYWPLAKMLHIETLDEDTVAELRGLSSRNPKYD